MQNGNAFKMTFVENFFDYSQLIQSKLDEIKIKWNLGEWTIYSNIFLQCMCAAYITSHNEHNEMWPLDWEE